MSDEVRRAVVERVKSPLNINLSILYPDAAIHFLKCPSHSVIRLEPTRPDGRPGAGPLPEREATNVRDPTSAPVGRARCMEGRAARAPGTLSHLRGCQQAALNTPLVGAGRSRVDRSRPRHGWSGAFTVPRSRVSIRGPPAARSARAARDGQSRRPTTARAASSSARARCGDRGPYGVRYYAPATGTDVLACLDAVAPRRANAMHGQRCTVDNPTSRSHTNTSRYSMITGRYPTSAPAAAPLDCHCAQIIPFSATCASHPPRGSHPPVQSALRPSSARSSQVAKARTNPTPTQPPPTHVRPPLGGGADYASSHRPRRGASQPRPAPITAPVPSRPSRRLSVLGGASQSYRAHHGA